MHPQQELASLGSLKFADYNPREMPEEEMTKLVASLREFGFIQPVVARREDGLIIGGHQRVDAYRRLLKEAGREDIDNGMVPVIYLSGISDERAKVLNLALNRISGEWNYAKLAGVIDGLTIGGLSGDDLALTGFSSSELADLLNLMGKDTALDESTGESDLEAALAAQSRRFSFEVETDSEAATCAAVLKQFGMTGPGDSSKAFVAALTLAGKTKKAAGKKR